METFGVEVMSSVWRRRAANTLPWLLLKTSLDHPLLVPGCMCRAHTYTQDQDVFARRTKSASRRMKRRAPSRTTVAISAHSAAESDRPSITPASPNLQQTSKLWSTRLIEVSVRHHISSVSFISLHRSVLPMERTLLIMECRPARLLAHAGRA